MQLFQTQRSPDGHVVYPMRIYDLLYVTGVVVRQVVAVDLVIGNVQLYYCQSIPAPQVRF